jgi:hypothetical protein
LAHSLAALVDLLLVDWGLCLTEDQQAVNCLATSLLALVFLNSFPHQLRQYCTFVFTRKTTVKLIPDIGGDTEIDCSHNISQLLKISTSIPQNVIAVHSEYPKHNATKIARLQLWHTTLRQRQNLAYQASIATIAGLFLLTQKIAVTTTEQINAYLQQLGWQAYIPAFAMLLQRFEGTQEWLEQETDTLPECLCAWLASLVGANAKPLPLALFALRSWALLYFRAADASKRWDYRQCSFMAFWQQAQEQHIDVWDDIHRVARPTLGQGLGFLRQHCDAVGTQG